MTLLLESLEVAVLLVGLGLGLTVLVELRWELRR